MSTTLTPETAEDRYLAQLRRRVAWQADRAASLRAASVAPDRAPFDLLDPLALAALIDTRPDDLRAPERRAFLVELAELVDEHGRLPSLVEGLVRLVFADLL